MRDMEEKFIITDAGPEHYGDILAINERLVRFLAPMDMPLLEEMAAMSALIKVAVADGRVAAFLLCFREGTEYQSVNYKWFSSRYDKFLYVDRVVVLEEYQDMGIGRAFYELVKDQARAAGAERVTAEIDILPANPKSLRFHKAFGFQEVGTQLVADGKKQVSLQCLEL